MDLVINIYLYPLTEELNIFPIGHRLKDSINQISVFENL